MKDRDRAQQSRSSPNRVRQLWRLRMSASKEDERELEQRKRVKTRKCKIGIARS